MCFTSKIAFLIKGATYVPSTTIHGCQIRGHLPRCARDSRNISHWKAEESTGLTVCGQVPTLDALFWISKGNLREKGIDEVRRAYEEQTIRG